MNYDRYLGLGLAAGALLAAAGCATAPKQPAIPVPQLAPLELFWNGHDNLTTASVQGQMEARKAGYGFVRVEGYVFANPEPGTKPLKQYWSEKRHDYMLLGTPLAKTLKKNAGYRLVRTEGFAYARLEPGAVPLKRYKMNAGDNFTLASVQGEKDALSAGYTLRRVEAYVIPVPEDVGLNR